MKTLVLVPVGVLLVAGCATIPTGPAIPVVPGPARTAEQFRNDDFTCRQYAQSGIAPAVPAANDRAAASAVTGTLLGAATGAIIGSVSGHAGEGAAIGAGAGALWGAATANAGYTSYELQRRYDQFYAQCMASRGHQFPGRVVYRAPAYPPANTPPPVAAGVPRVAPAGSAPAAPPPGAALPGNFPPPDTPAPVTVAPDGRRPVVPAPAVPPPRYPPPAYPPAATPPPGTPPPT